MGEVRCSCVKDPIGPGGENETQTGIGEVGKKAKIAISFVRMLLYCYFNTKNVSQHNLRSNPYDT